MRNTLLIISVAIVALIFSIWGYNALRANSVSGKIDVYTAVPIQPIAMLHINNIADLQNSLLYNNTYWLDVSKLEAIAPIHSIFTKTDSLKDVSSDIKEFLSRRETLISIFADSISTHSLISMSISKNDWKMLNKTVISSLFPAYKSEKINVQRKNVLLLTHQSDSLYIAYENYILIATASRQLLAKSLEQSDKKTSIFANDQAFQTVKGIASRTTPANLFVNIKELPQVTKKWFHPDAHRMFQFTDMYADWCGFDISFMEERITIAGFSSTNENNKHIQQFNQQEAGINTLAQSMPQHTYFFNHAHISELDVYKKNVQNLLSPAQQQEAKLQLEQLTTSTGENPSLFFNRHFDKEIAFGYAPYASNFDQNGFVLIKLKDEPEAMARLQRMATESTPNATTTNSGNIRIIQFKSNGFAGSIFGTQYAFPEEYIAVHKGLLYIAPSRNTLMYILQQKERNRTLNRASRYVGSTRAMYQFANNTLYADIPAVIRRVQSVFTPEKTVWINSTRALWNNFETLILQAENKSNDLQFQQLVVNYTKKTEIDILEERRAEILAEKEQPSTEETPVATPTQPEKTATVSAESVPPTPAKKTSIEAIKTWELALTKPIATNPQMVVNHTTGQHEIMVQDTDNFLYLISSEGKLIWRIRIGGRIISDIHQVDMYGNKRLQMVFNTATKLYVIDREGRNMNRFPIDFSAKASAGIAIFDYNNNGDYRFFVPLTNKKIALYKKDGTQPSDWKFKQSEAIINKPLQYFRTNGMDFLVASDNKKSYFLHRRGNERLIPEKPVIASANNNFSLVYSGGADKFVTTDKNGNILLVNPNKKVDKVQLHTWSNQHAFTPFTHQKANYYVFVDNKRIEMFDEEFNSVMLYEDILSKKSTIMVWKNLLATYNEKSKEMLLIDLPARQILSSGIKTDKNLFYMGQLKPYKKTCVVVSEKNKIMNYLLE
jgi:hypothetical protein